MAGLSNSTMGRRMLLGGSAAAIITAARGQTAPAPVRQAPAASAPADPGDAHATLKAVAVHDILISNMDKFLLYWSTRDDGKAYFQAQLNGSQPDKLAEVYEKLTDWGSTLQNMAISGVRSVSDQAIIDLEKKTIDLNTTLNSFGPAILRIMEPIIKLDCKHPLQALLIALDNERKAASVESAIAYNSMAIAFLRDGRDKNLVIGISVLERMTQEAAGQRPPSFFGPRAVPQGSGIDQRL